MDLFAELIGELSNVRFASVSDRFIAELEKYNNQTIMKERQSHMEMLIKGMRYLKIKLYPVDALEETADFIYSCAGFFKNAHGAKVKHAYADLFIQLLLPAAEVSQHLFFIYQTFFYFFFFFFFKKRLQTLKSISLHGQRQ